MDTMTFKQGSDDQRKILAKLSAPSLTDTADTAVQSPQQHSESAGAESVCVSCDSVPIVCARDPRKDPRPGDVLRLCEETYRVLRVDSKGVEDYCESGVDKGNTLRNSLREWKGYMIDAEVIHAAD